METLKNQRGAIGWIYCGRSAFRSPFCCCCLWCAAAL